jgi:hypothetical protein
LCDGDSDYLIANDGPANIRAQPSTAHSEGR